MSSPAPAPAMPSAISDDQLRQLNAAGDLLRQGRGDEAVIQLRQLTAANSDLAQGQRLLGVALEETGDLLGAEAAFRRALAADPGLIAAATGLAEVLRSADRGREAIDVLAPYVDDQTRDLNLLTYYASALQSVGRFDEAVVYLERAARASAASAVAEHNLAGAMGDAGQPAESESAARRALAKGLDAPETWLVLARALKDQNRFAEAEAAYGEAIRRRPAYPDARGDLAELVWVQTGASAEALAVLDQPLAERPRDPGLLLQKAKLLEHLGQPQAAAEALGLALAVIDDPYLHVAAARLAVRDEPERALGHARRAFALRPDNYSAIAALCEARLATGRPREAVPLAELLCERQPWDQYALALLTTAWRLIGDRRYADLCDYDRLIGDHRLDTPVGWSSLEAYFADLAPALEGLHPFLGHPVGQSVRHGSQTRQDLTQVASPPIKALPQALDGPIRRYIAALGAGEDPLRRRISAGYRFNGMWSVKLKPGAGFHADHIHHRGWLSSACYVALPRSVETGREGWIKFGEPGVATRPALPPERFFKPEVGQLLLFPSYMWHGTTVFTGNETRLSVAFDVLPA